MRQAYGEINSKLRIIRAAELPSAFTEAVVELLTIPNPDYFKAVDEGESPKGIPELIEMFEVEGEDLILPRGFAYDLADLAERFDFEFAWLDDRTAPRGFYQGKAIDLRPWQTKMVKVAKELEQGILKAPTGSGKTVAMLELFRICPGPGIVIVNTKEIADQWIKRAQKWTPKMPLGFIGDGKFEVADRGLTVALQGTLWSRREKLAEEDFFKLFVCAVLDECHHATARTYNDVFDRFWAKYRFGVSATPEKTGEFRLSEIVLGPIILEITEEEIGDKITKPVVEVVETKLGKGQRLKKGKKKTEPAWARRKNYETLLKGLVRDPDRNNLIANEIVLNHRNNANLVLSKRIEHLELIYDALLGAGYPEERLIAMVGAHEIGERGEAIEMAEAGDCVMLTTLADEALDVPRLDRVHLVFPTRNPELILQQIGRIRRTHPDKADSIVLDYCDRQIEKFYSQFMTRRHEIYDPKGWRVIKRKVTDPHDRDAAKDTTLAR